MINGKNNKALDAVFLESTFFPAKKYFNVSVFF